MLPHAGGREGHVEFLHPPVIVLASAKQELPAALDQSLA
jgi:hypothetical protein